MWLQKKCSNDSQLIYKGWMKLNTWPSSHWPSTKRSIKLLTQFKCIFVTQFSQIAYIFRHVKKTFSCEMFSWFCYFCNIQLTINNFYDTVSEISFFQKYKFYALVIICKIKFIFNKLSYKNNLKSYIEFYEKHYQNLS